MRSSFYGRGLGWIRGGIRGAAAAGWLALVLTVASAEGERVQTSAFHFVDLSAFATAGSAETPSVRQLSALPSGRQVFHGVTFLIKERVGITGGQVYIDGTPLREPYVVADRRPWNYAEVMLGPREYFAIGDNRSMRASDHDFGRVDRSRLIGKVLF